MRRPSVFPHIINASFHLNGVNSIWMPQPERQRWLDEWNRSRNQNTNRTKTKHEYNAHDDYYFMIASNWNTMGMLIGICYITNYVLSINFWYRLPSPPTRRLLLIAWEFSFVWTERITSANTSSPPTAWHRVTGTVSCMWFYASHRLNLHTKWLLRGIHGAANGILIASHCVSVARCSLHCYYHFKHFWLDDNMHDGRCIWPGTYRFVVCETMNKLTLIKRNTKKFHVET